MCNAKNKYLIVIFVSVIYSSTTVLAAPRTFVSGAGSDSSPCTLLKPCRTFDRAIAQADAGGEVVAIDTAGYGSFTVNKSIAIEAAPGVYAGITVAGTAAAIAIDVAAGASDVVTLRGITINSTNSNAVGVRFLSGGMLHIDHCSVNGANIGVWSVASSALDIRSSVMTGNLFGIRIEPTSGTGTASIGDVRLEHNSDGLDAVDGASVTVNNSTSSDNTNLGFGATSFSSRAVTLNIENCVSSNNGHFGVAVASLNNTSATVVLSNSTVTNNQTYGLNIGNFPAVLLSRGNNTITGNGFDIVGVLRTLLPS